METNRNPLHSLKYISKNKGIEKIICADFTNLSASPKDCNQYILLSLLFFLA